MQDHTIDELEYRAEIKNLPANDTSIDFAEIQSLHTSPQGKRVLQTVDTKALNNLSKT